MPNAQVTRRRVRRPPLWLAAVAAVAFHGTIFAGAQLFGLTFIGAGMTAAVAAKAPPAAEDVELASSCRDDVAFHTSGRAAMCFAPWVASVDDCLAEVQMRMWIDRSSCDARNDPGTAVTMIEPRAAERVTPIDPERLLEEFRPPQLKPPPQQQAPQQPQQQEAAPPPQPQRPPQQLPQQVVETVKPSEEKEPDNARFLSEYNVKVDKQHVSRGARNEPMVAKAKPEELTPKDKPRDDPSRQKADPDRERGNNRDAPDVPGKLSMRNPGPLFPAQAEQEAKTRGVLGGAAGAQVADGYTARRGDGALDQQRRERSEAPRGQGGAGGGVPDLPNLKPTEEVLERALGGGSVDHLEDVDSGDETSLSSKRWVYASFFNRLKRQVAQNWDPNTVWRHTDPTGTVYGSKTRVTEVRVSLSPRGDLAKIMVVSPSGSVELDEEAMRAFRSAAPFVNPPDGLVQKDNLITFGFSFYFQLGEQHLSWRLPQAM